MMSIVILAVACGAGAKLTDSIAETEDHARKTVDALLSANRSSGARLTDSIAKTEDHARKTVDALLSANRVIAGQNTSSNAVSETGVVGRFFIPSRAYAQEVPSSGTKQQIDIETLRSEWGPRYKAAQDSYAELNSHIANSERYADDYFRQQHEHIESLRDADNVDTIRAAMANAYNQQMQYYEDWIDSAYMVRKQCAAMLDNMHNVNTLIEFTSDAADFQTLLDEQVAIPEVIASLNQAMSDFQSRTQGILGQLEQQPSESQVSAGPSLPVVSTATRYPTPAPTHTPIPIPTATPVPTSQPMSTPYPSPGPADTPTPEPALAPSPTPTAVATPEPTAVPTPTASPVTPTPVPLSIRIVNISFVGTGYTLYLEIPDIPGGDAHEQLRLVVSNQYGVIKDEYQSFVRARNGDYVGAVALDSDVLPNPDIEWVKANLTIHAIPQRRTGKVDANPNLPITRARATVTPRPTARPSPTFTPRHTPTPNPKSPIQERFNRDYLETNILRLINEYRVANGRPALRVDARLTQIARNHSNDMARTGHYSHTNLRGESPTARARRAGYDCHNPLSIGIAENIHVLYGHTSTLKTDSGTIYYWTTQEKLAKRFADEWTSSPGHRRNILDSRYMRTGLGVAYGSYWDIEHAIFVTHKFC